MAKYLFDFKEEVAVDNGKSPDPTELIEKMKLRGKVTPFEEAVAALSAEYQATIDGLVAKLRAIADQELSEDDIIFLNFYRERKAANGEVYQKRIDSLESYLEEVRVASQKRAAQITELVSQLAELSAQ